MKTVVLSASLDSSLDWSLSILQSNEPILWKLDFSFKNLTDQAAFHSYALAVEEFAKKIWQPTSLGVILYQGSIESMLGFFPYENKHIAADLFADYLHRLASFLPDEIPPYCLLGDPQTGQEALLLSKERFQHLNLTLQIDRNPLGLLLPQLERCTDEVFDSITQLLLKGSYRIIPESLLTEMWDGLDILVVIDKTLSIQGERKIKGFIAAGGEVKIFGVEGFEPPTYCSQSSRASQAALYSES
jgi:hypothetical protein